MSENLSKKTIRDFDFIEDEIARVDAICLYCDCTRNNFLKEGLALPNEAYLLAKKNNYKKGEARCLKAFGYQNWHLGELKLAKEQLRASRELMASIDYYYEWGEVCLIEAMIMWNQGNYEPAMSYVLDNLKLLDERGETEAQMWLYWTLGVYNYDLKNYDTSIKYYNQALGMVRVMTRYNPDPEGWTLLGLGSVYGAKGDQQKALEYLEEARAFAQKYNQWMQAARIHFEIGNIKLAQQRLDEAKLSYIESYRTRKTYQIRPAMVSSLLSLAEVKIQQKDYEEALADINEALEIAQAIESKSKIYKCHEKFAQFYEAIKNYHKAYIHVRLFYQIKSEVIGEETDKKLQVLEANFATQKAIQEKEIHRLKNVELKTAHHHISKKNREIMASITYAQRIQNAMLPPLKEIQKVFPESFVLFKPFNVVSGDFYWLKVIGDTTFVAVVDCTGHGIPGAFMSMLSYSLLNEVVNKAQNLLVGEILDQLHVQIRKLLRQEQTNNKDGMDICLCSFMLNSQGGMLVQYAGAKRSLYCVANNQLNEVKGDRQNIGGFVGLQRTKFSTIKVQVSLGTALYLSTDGYCDSPNTKRRSFGRKRFKNLLQKISTESFQEQKKRLEQSLADFQEGVEQRDDILVLGLKV